MIEINMKWTGYKNIRWYDIDGIEWASVREKFDNSLIPEKLNFSVE